MAIPVNPLAKAHLDKLAGLDDSATTAGEEELERRTQELWHVFMTTYFTGDPVAVADGSGGTVQKTFPALELLYETDTVPATISTGVLHMAVADRRVQRRDRISGGLLLTEQISRNWIVRVPSQADPENTSDAAAAASAERECRRVSDLVRWLLESDEKQALALKGITQVEVSNGPRSIAAGAWHMRQMLTTERIRHHVRSNEP